ncbi:serine/threonine-protein kinase [Arthrobacter koreensis]|uniref:serine/threonine-protein kinase n=1 Tax=Arthrobacter koreensis TaxID=199136 RepID=UPI0036DC9732
MATGASVELDNGKWELRDQLGMGGFGVVYHGRQGGKDAAIKFIPKDKGAAREVELRLPSDARNVVPVTGLGQDPDNWIISMPLADDTLERVIAKHDGRLPEAVALKVLSDVADALISLDGRIVHRDIKPGNILLLEGKWCLSDFGIAKYAEAVTGTMTHKGVGSYHYVAPELWAGESANSQSDMYALGIVAYEVLTGNRPFEGTSVEVMNGHLTGKPRSTGAPSKLDWAIMDCLAKKPELRPTPAQFASRLTPAQPRMPSKAAAAMAAADQAIRDERDLAVQQALQFEADAAERKAHLEHAAERLSQIAEGLLARIQTLSSEAYLETRHGLGWTLRLGGGTLTFSQMMHNPHWQFVNSENDPFVVMAAGGLYLKQSVSEGSYLGRSHALWYADAQELENFQWYETAFAQTGGNSIPLGRPIPFEAEFESAEARKALLGQGEFRVAWPFTPIDPDDVDEFADRWAVWLAEASAGQLKKPEIWEAVSGAQGTWRTKE